MYLGRFSSDVLDRLKPLYPPNSEDTILIAQNKSIWLVSLKQARYVKHHIARISPGELISGFSQVRRDLIMKRLSVLKKKGVL